MEPSMAEVERAAVVETEHDRIVSDLLEQADRYDKLDGIVRRELSRLDGREAAHRIRRNREQAKVLARAPTVYRGLDELDRNAPEAQPPIIGGGWWGYRDIAELIARRKVGKTSIVRNLIKDLVDGTPWLGKPGYAIRPEGYRVLLWDGEERQRRWLYWMNKLDVKRRAMIDTVFFEGQAVDLTADVWRSYAIAAVNDCGSEILILDNYSKLSAGSADNNVDIEVNRFFDCLEEIRNAAPRLAGILLVVHAGKADAGARGSSAFEDRPAELWTVTRKRQGSGPTFHVEGREADEFTIDTIYDPDTRRYTATQEATSPIPDGNGEVWERLLAEPNITRSNLLGRGRAREQRQEELAGLLASGRVVEVREGRTRRYRVEVAER